MSALLRIEGVVAGYGRGDILHGLDLVLEEGAITCLVGPNGAGKSTVLKTLSGLLRPRDGRILLDGTDICRRSPAQVLELGIVHVAQERSLFPLMTVWDNLLMGGHVLGDRALVRRRAEAVADRFQLVAERRHERAGALSGGQQKLVEIARALMLEPRLVMLDEPTMGLDPKARHLIFEMVRELNEEGRTLLLVEAHEDAPLLDYVADRQTRACPVAPRRSVHRGQKRLRRHVPDALERVLERALLRGDLELRRRVLKRAAAAGAEVRAARHDAVGRRALDARRAGELPGRLALERLDLDALAGQPALDEDGLALDARDAAALGVERADVDGEQGQGVPRWRNRAFYRAPLE